MLRWQGSIRLMDGFLLDDGWEHDALRYFDQEWGC